MKKKRLLTILICLSLPVQFFSHPSAAEEVIGLDPGALKDGFEVGTEISYITYEEPDLMKDKGFMYGICGSYTIRELIMLKIEGKYSYGRVDYTSNSTGSIDDIPDNMLEFRLIGGYDIPVSDLFYITPYSGFGYRYLHDDSSEKLSSTGAAGYARESNYLYMPFGLELAVPSEDGFSVGFTFEYDLFLWGLQKSYLSDANFNYNDLENRQREGWGLRGSLFALVELENIDIILEPFIRYWSIEKSDHASLSYAGTVVGYGFEPKNNSTEFGLKFSVVF